MKYAEAARRVILMAQAERLRTIPVSPFVEARAFENLNPGGLETSGRFFMARGKQIGLQSEFDAPGFQVRAPLFERTDQGVIDPFYPPAFLLRDWSWRELEQTHGKISVDFIAELRLLYMTRIFGRGVLDSRQEFGIRGMLDAGLLVQMIEGPEQSERWNTIAKAMRDAFAAYFRKQFDAAVREGVSLRARVEFWDRVYSITEGVAQAPSKIAEFGFSAISGFAKNNPLIFLGLLGVGFVVLAPNLQSAAKLLKGK